MKRLFKLLFMVVLFLIMSRSLYSSVIFQKQDTLQVKAGKQESVRDGKNQTEKVNQGNQAMNAGKNNPSKAVKQIKGARPDMSKARGARPPQITRPSGTGVPRGMGKPGGAGRKPGR
jgi:hypothetical protein